MLQDIPKRYILHLFVFAFTVLSLLPNAVAQTSRGTVTGLVTDQQGAAIAGSVVELLNPATNVTRSATSNEAGLYRFDAVELGVYDVTIKAAGFRTFVSRSVNVQGGQVASVDARLEVGETQTTIEVSAETVQLQTEAPVRGGNIATTSIVQLPVATRNPVALALNLPGISTNRFATAVNSFSVNGSRGRSNNFLIDGTENNDISVTGQGFQITNPDAVAEVAVQTSNYDAEFGRAGGAVVNTITKSGTNQLHGTAAYLLDSTVDDAITNTQSLSPQIQQRGRPLPGTDQWFSGTVGGPIIKDRTFFFAGFQENRLKSEGTNALNVISSNGRATMNSLFPSGTSKTWDIYNQVTAGTDATSQFYTNALGNGRPDVEFGTAIIVIPNKVTKRQFLVRGDHKISENDQLSLRYLNDKQDDPQGAATNPLPGFFTGEQNRYHNALVNHTHIFGTNKTNELRLHYNRIELLFPANTENPLGRTLARYDIQGGISSIGVQTNLPQGRIANNYGIQDTFTIIKGAHSFRVGFDLLQQRSWQIAPSAGRGLFDYRAGGGFTSWANFVDDFAGSGPGAGSVRRDFGSAVYYPELFRQAYFFQDRWKVNADLTLTLGVRYENFGTPMNSLITPAYAGLFNVDPVTFTGPFSEPNSVKRDNNNWAPTIGLAWSPNFTEGFLGSLFGAKKSVWRFGYQIGYDSFFNNIASNAQGSSPNLIATSVQSTVTTATPRGLPNTSGQLPVQARAPSALDNQTLISPTLVNPYYQRWSGGVQRELPFNVLLDVSYVGSRGVKLFANEEFNPPVPAALRIVPQTSTPIPASRLSTRLDALQGERTIRTNAGSSSYHSGQVYVNRRFANGFLMTFAYTYSKLLDNASEIFNFNSGGSLAEVPSIYGGLPNERAVSLFDRTHRASFTWVYQLPWLRSQQGAFGRVLGGWEVAGIAQFETGVPLNVLNGVDANGLAGAGSDRPDFNPNGRPGTRAVPNATSPTGYVNPDDGNKPISASEARYIGRSTFTGTLPDRPGNLGRNTERTPGIKNWNLNIIKSVRITERFSTQFRTEFFNLFNTPQYATPSVSPFAPQAQGLIENNVFNASPGRFLQPQFVDGGGRVIRYQLKIIF